MRLIDRSGKSYYGMQIGFAAIQDSVVEGTMFHYLDQQTKANYDKYLAREDHHILLTPQAPGLARNEFYPKIRNTVTTKQSLNWVSLDRFRAKVILEPGDWILVDEEGNITGIKETDRNIELKADYRSSVTNRTEQSLLDWDITLKVKVSDSDDFMDHLIYDPLYESIIRKWFSEELDIAVNTTDNTKVMITADGIPIPSEQWVIGRSGKIITMTDRQFTLTYEFINRHVYWDRPW